MICQYLSGSTKTNASTLFMLGKLRFPDISTDALATLLTSKLCTERVRCHPPFFFVPPFPSLTAPRKAEKLPLNIILCERVACPGAGRGGSVMKGNVALGSSAEDRVRAESYSSNY